jgi:hypothetical protein
MPADNIKAVTMREIFFIIAIINNDKTFQHSDGKKHAPNTAAHPAAQKKRRSKDLRRISLPQILGNTDGVVKKCCHEKLN